MEIKAAKNVDVQALSWAIYGATGLNLGGWYNPSGIPQTGALTWSQLDGLTVICPDATPLVTVAQIEVLIAGHDALAPLPADFPPSPPPVLPPDPAIVIAVAAADVVAEIDKAFARRATSLTTAEKTAMQSKIVALAASTRGL